MPAMPAAGSMNPEASRFNFCTLIFASTGVCAASSELIGPALPDSFMLPPAGVSAVNWKGNEDAKEKFVTSTFTLS